MLYLILYYIYFHVVYSGFISPGGNNEDKSSGNKEDKNFDGEEMDSKNHPQILSALHCARRIGGSLCLLSKYYFEPYL